MIKFNKGKTKRNLISVLIMIILVTVDQVIKYFVELNLSPIVTKEFIPGFIRFHYHQNYVGMMGIFDGKPLLITVLSIVCMVAVVVIMFTDLIKTKFDYICIVMIAAGGMGNIIDRIIRGYVVDYIEYLFIDFYIFNFADCLITVGAFAMIIYQLVLVIKESKAKKVGAENG